VVTVWNTITGGIDAEVGDGYAGHASSLLGVTAQNTGGGLTVYADALPGFALSCNYCTNEQAIRDHVAAASANWAGTAPGFILIQAQPWQGVTPTSFLNVQNSLSDDYVVVRPDNWFQLLRQVNGLPIEPVLPIVDGLYRLVNEGSGKCVTAMNDGTVAQVTCADDVAQRWQVTDLGAGYREIAAASDPSLVLSVAEGATEDQGAIAVSAATGAAEQRWQTVWVSGAGYQLFAEHSQRCLDVPGGVSDDIALQQLTCSGEAAQHFQFADPDWPPDDDPMLPMPEPPVEEPPTQQPEEPVSMPPTGGQAAGLPDQPMSTAGAASENPNSMNSVGGPSPQASGCACHTAQSPSDIRPLVSLFFLGALICSRRRR
jgi:hypothetical protein